MQFVLGVVSHASVVKMLEQHLEDMYATSPPESVHALDLSELKQDDIRFWTLWEADRLCGCGAIKRLSPEHGELKSMRVANYYRQRGIGERILHHLQADAAQNGMTRLSLETGSMGFFLPARRLYQKFGFVECAPFGRYQDDPNSVFMTKRL
ncbi:GNAT family N-acetyltransferase [Shewanella loihica]|uniref:GCN5-related N-acetyltransferase n=1 Tax=Shewanella loihica (strain ATCC BAA-1088 / PV-4) TaxID=323850 RepID=A3QIU5_SHELP|nr:MULTISPECIES: GNAT family N-acetyltransferase [Shewanella]ABO25393.1 GCN5-related N-acetyltransferase [Shewanella loihica PV-4]QYJ82163.1 GNAT family N-acetyltransferase [Shewanella aegiceratis]QYJ93496.1 GNAT family N-acetyltransferase [Shewanella spartinae]QYJ97384.1 GNAT family N-acetyltransferase [Shewanella alkalitolerans]QYK12636.1 GNAT family N-acetyltransferase [Shewanella rhizosphaerae]